MPTTTLASALLLLAPLFSAQVSAATFNLVYDSVDDGVINPADIIGTGTFSYDGPAVAGTFLLSDLTGVSFEATLTGDTGTSIFAGPPFDPADASLIAISVTDVGGGQLQLVFTGESAETGGSLDIRPDASSLITHEPEPLLSASGGPRLYASFHPDAGLNAFGDYVGTSVVPLPPAILFLASAIAALGFTRRKS